MMGALVSIWIVLAFAFWLFASIDRLPYLEDGFIVLQGLLGRYGRPARRIDLTTIVRIERSDFNPGKLSESDQYDLVQQDGTRILLGRHALRGKGAAVTAGIVSRITALANALGLEIVNVDR